MISFVCFVLKLLATGVLEARLLFVELTDADVAGGKANAFREFLVVLGNKSRLCRYKV